MTVLPPIVYTPSPNFSSRDGTAIDLIVVHDCEGSYGSAVQWLSDPKSKVSAHYVVREDGLQVTSMVDEKDRAWHAVEFNARSIGIEMAGFESHGFGDVEWKTLADIVVHLLYTYKIPCKWAKGGVGPGFCSHYDLGVAGGNHDDPTTDTSIWNDFVKQVEVSYASGPPTGWGV